MENNGNQIITAVMSKLISQRDNVLVQLDLILNKNLSDKGVSNIVEQATKLFSELSKIELTIETVTGVLENNKKQNQFSEQVNELKKSFIELQKNNNQEDNGDNT